MPPPSHAARRRGVRVEFARPTLTFRPPSALPPAEPLPDSAPPPALSSSRRRLDAWFAARGWTVFDFQEEAWRAYRAGESGLIHAATGTGKTLAAWLGPVLEWLDESARDSRDTRDSGDTRDAGDTGDAQCARDTQDTRGTGIPRSPARTGAGKKPTAPPLQVLWLTPLKALAADTLQSLAEPLAELAPAWTLEARTGDSSSAVRARQRRRLPSALVTTPESLSLLLSRPEAREAFAELRAVVVDEWHELLSGKRGTQTELCLTRLRAWRPGLRTWGLSATLGNPDTALAALVGVANVRAGRGRLVRGLAAKAVDIRTLLPEDLTRFPWAGHLGLQMLPEVLQVIEAGRSTLVFTNTRAQTERWYQAILDARPDWAGQIALHHGSLAADSRRWVEAGLSSGGLRAVVTTSSLDLGVDFSPVEHTVQVGSPKGVGRLLQRAGRSGHQPGAASRLYLAPAQAFDLLEAAAARAAVAEGAVEPREPLAAPMDVLIQHLVTIAVGGGFEAEAMYAEVRDAHAYRDLPRADWEWALRFLTQGGALAAYPEYRRVVIEDGLHKVTDRGLAARHRANVGTIVGDAQITVAFVGGARLGEVEESFIARLNTGERFVFAGRSLELVRVRDLHAYVRLARGPADVVPAWTGGGLPISAELAAAVRGLVDAARRGVFASPELEALRPLLAAQARLSRLPAAGEWLIEALRTRAGHHLFFYPFAGRAANEALAALTAHRLSRRAPVTFSFAANDYGFELRSAVAAPLEAALAEGLLSPEGWREDLEAAVNAAELAKRRFREIARVANLILQGRHPGERKSLRQLQTSGGLLFQVFRKHEPDNLLLRQAREEALERGLQAGRAGAALTEATAGGVALTRPPRLTPFGFPLVVEGLRARLSSESLAERIGRMRLELERKTPG